jgi:excisionase family DNA binding protein
MELISVAQAAKLLNLSRMQVFRKIKQGRIKAKKIGRAYVVDKTSLGPIFEKTTQKEEQLIKQAVDRTFKEYGETLRKLGAE